MDILITGINLGGYPFKIVYLPLFRENIDIAYPFKWLLLELQIVTVREVWKMSKGLRE